MSLHHAAQHLIAQGRGPDNNLVHMSNKEVAGLQKIAESFGGSLTRNPHTGLPEAGVLDNLMPMIVGAGLAYATGGASLAGEMGLGAVGLGGLSNAAVIGGGLGLLDYAKTGSLKDAMMTGMGAYGGAGLGAGLAATGAGPIPAYDAATGQVAPALTTPTVPTATPAGAVSSGNAGMDALIGNNGMTSTPVATLPDNIDMGGGFNPATGTAASPVHATPGVADFLKDNKQFLAMGAAPALAGLMAQTKQGAPAAAQQQGMIRPYKYAYNKQTPTSMVGAAYTPGQDTSERTWFQPEYTALTPYKAAEGGLMDLNAIHAAGGGPVERMSDATAIGANTGYPQANLNQGAYATPWQTPISRNVVSDSADTGVDQVTGEQNRFAEGGVTGSGGLDLHIPIDLGGGGQGGFGGGANGYQGVGSGGGQGGFGGGQLGQMRPLPAPMQQQQDPFAGDTNWQNYQTQMQSMQNDFLNSDQYKNMDQLRQTMQDYRAQRMGAMAQPTLAMAEGGMAYAQGGISTLGGYSDGGRLLKGPGDGMSDNIPAQIGAKQPARLADGEFVVPADVVSHLGNGSTDAGAKQLYKMMDKVRSARTGNKKQGKQINPNKFVPA